MPLPSVLNGANQCRVLTKRAGQQCKNPAAFGCASCRMHGAHKSRNVLRGVNHPHYQTGGETLEAKAERSAKSVMFKYLLDLGNHVGLFYTQLKTRGRPPSGYIRLNLTDPEELALAILKILPNK